MSVKQSVFKIFPLTLIFSGLTGLPALAVEEDSSKQPKPEDTEVWEPEPKLVHVDRGGVPSDAIILFDKDNLDAWQHVKTKGPAAWHIEHDIFTVTPKVKGGIGTKESFCDVQLHLEWRSPPIIVGDKNKKKRGGNSGIYFQGRYEVQIFDSHNYKIYSNGQASSVYKQYAPLVDTTKPAGHWQTFDIIYTAPKFSKTGFFYTFTGKGSLESPGYMTVFHNGVLTQNHVELQGPTSHIGKPLYEAHGCAPITLQNHGDEVSFRNIWVRRL